MQFQSLKHILPICFNSRKTARTVLYRADASHGDRQAGPGPRQHPRRPRGPRTGLTWREGHDRRAVARTDGGGVDGDGGARHLETDDQARSTRLTMAN